MRIGRAHLLAVIVLGASAGPSCGLADGRAGAVDASPADAGPDGGRPSDGSLVAPDVGAPDSGPVELGCGDLGPHDSCATTRPLPTTFPTVIDLTDPSETPGTCAEPRAAQEGRHTRLPEDRADYPVLVHVSAEGFDGSCSACGSPDVPPPEAGATTYGAAFSVPYDTWANVRYPTRVFPVLHVNEPWVIVSGGNCGEACPSACATEGYLEFQPTTCLGSYAGGFGVATTATAPPPAQLVVDLVEEKLFSPCCPWRCE